jgi:UDP-N-acetylglucosamine--N-acetylmuramyl-(pentapeptide) pyrophosphoryl-undecaprenol N-acetylglucosamine transferase
MRVGIAGGGTGGHIEPALNLADELRRRDPATHIVVFGTERGLEVDLVPARGYELTLIPPVPLPRRVNKDLFSLPARVRRSARAVRDVVEAEGLDVLCGFGGYVSIPAYLGARRAKTPFVVHEANARPGLANKVGARLTPFVAENYAGTLPHAQRLGCPLRGTIAGLDRGAARAEAREFFGLAPDGPTVLVFGGSQGAASINAAIWSAADELSAAGVQILHAVGARQWELAQSASAGRPAGYRAVPFIDRMDLAYAAADIAVCRSGAMTCAEVAAVGLPAIYIPYAVGNGEQRFNAAPVVDAGGGLMIDDGAIDGSRLLAALLPLVSDSVALGSMSAAAAAYGIADGSARLADMVQEAGGRA